MLSSGYIHVPKHIGYYLESSHRISFSSYLLWLVSYHLIIIIIIIIIIWFSINRGLMLNLLVSSIIIIFSNFYSVYSFLLLSKSQLVSEPDHTSWPAMTLFFCQVPQSSKPYKNMVLYSSSQPYKNMDVWHKYALKWTRFKMKSWVCLTFWHLYP
jgi:hypothetical protein